ncbi:MAG: hypothetical protein MK226_08530 [Saprospiraceae bacterium]|jgi:hypothetical protein|nr:hypothetical protein [Saprospiraceae bacterium]
MIRLKNINWLAYIGLAIGLLVLVRIFPPLLPRLILTLGLLIVMVSLIMIPVLIRRKKRAESLNGNERIEQQMRDCQDHILKIEDKLKEIDIEIKAVCRDLKDPDVSEKNKVKLKSLLSSFQQEKKLRQQKRQFYFICISKLEKMQLNQRVKKDIQQKKEKLNELKENHFEELADMENVRSDIEMDVFYLDTIDELSSQVQKMDDQKGRLNLQKELEKITKELNQL